MNYGKGIISELGYDPRLCSQIETDKVLSAFELETILVCNGWRVNHETRFRYDATRNIKDQKGKLQRQKITVGFYMVRVYVDAEIPMLQQMIEKFKYYEWFDR